MNLALLPVLAEARAGQFVEQRSCEALRDDLAAQRSGFKRGVDVIQDLRELMALEAASQAPPPIPVAHVAASPTQTKSPAAASEADTLLARYEAVANDPVALAEFLHDNQDALRRCTRQFDRAPRAVATDSTRQRVDSSALLAEYEQVRNDPEALADFISDNQEALLRLSNRSSSAAMVPVTEPSGDAPIAKCESAAEVNAAYTMVKNSPRALARFLQVNGPLIRTLMIAGKLA